MYLKMPFSKTLFYALFLFLITYLAFQPGIMSYDSFDQYAQAISGSFTDHHPPMMSILWSYLTLLYESPATLLILHLAMLWTALYLLAEKYKNNYIFLIGMLPFVVNFAGILWKDVGISFSWLLALAIFLSLEKIKTRRILFLIFIFYGAVIRPNALPALVPILMYFYYVEYKWKFLKSGMLSIITIVLFFLINNTIAYKILDTEKVYSGPKMVMIHDLSGISKRTKQNYFPATVNEKYNVKQIIEKYDPVKIASIFWGNGENFSYSNIDKSELFQAWKNAVKNNPRVYIQNRWDNFKALLRIGHRHGYYIWNDVRVKDYKNIDIIYKKNILYNVINTYVLKFNRFFGFLFTGWFWLICSFILLLSWKRNLFSSILGFSSILYIVPYAFIGQAPDFRYIYLSIILVLLGFLLLLYPQSFKVNKHVK